MAICVWTVDFGGTLFVSRRLRGLMAWWGTALQSGSWSGQTETLPLGLADVCTPPWWSSSPAALRNTQAGSPRRWPALLPERTWSRLAWAETQKTKYTPGWTKWWQDMNIYSIYIAHAVYNMLNESKTSWFLPDWLKVSSNPDSRLSSTAVTGQAMLSHPKVITGCLPTCLLLRVTVSTSKEVALQ